MGPANLRTLAAWQDLVHSLHPQDQNLETQTLLSRVNPTILRLVDPEHHIAVKATFQMAAMASNLGEYKKAEDLFRQVFQINLSKLGPRTPTTGNIITRMYTQKKDNGLRTKNGTSAKEEEY